MSGRGRLSLFRADDTRSTPRRVARLAVQLTSLARLPWPVARFWVRALRTARAKGDTWSIDVACRPAELRALLEALDGARRVAELGTASAWTTAALVLADPRREVDSYDVVAHPQREAFLALLEPEARDRIRLHDRPGGRGPDDPPAVDAVFIDSSHEREETRASFVTWEPAVAPGGIVAFHDWRDPAYPGVTEAVRELGLQGDERGRLFVWRKAR